MSGGGLGQGRDLLDNNYGISPERIRDYFRLDVLCEVLSFTKTAGRRLEGRSRLDVGRCL